MICRCGYWHFRYLLAVKNIWLIGFASALQRFAFSSFWWLTDHRPRRRCPSLSEERRRGGEEERRRGGERGGQFLSSPNEP